MPVSKVTANVSGDTVQYPVLLPQSLVAKTSLPEQEGEVEIRIEAVKVRQNEVEGFDITDKGGELHTAVVLSPAVGTPGDIPIRKYKHYESSNQTVLYLPRYIGGALELDGKKLSWVVEEEEDRLVGVVISEEVFDESFGEWREKTDRGWYLSDMETSGQTHTTVIPEEVVRVMELESGEEVGLVIERHRDEFVLVIQKSVEGLHSTEEVRLIRRGGELQQLCVEIPHALVLVLGIQNEELCWYPQEEKVRVTTRRSYIR